MQKRPADNIEEQIWKAQFGFRANHSTSEALYINSRIQDFYECSGDEFFMLFSDWEKAFDKIDQSLLIDVISRLNIPNKTVRILKSFYREPKFRIRDREGYSKLLQAGSRHPSRMPAIPILILPMDRPRSTRRRNHTNHSITNTAPSTNIQT